MGCLYRGHKSIHTKRSQNQRHFIVDTNGDVQNAYAIRSSQREFEASAIQAVSKWKFKPGRKGGRDVPTHMQVPIVFTLNEE